MARKRNRGSVMRRLHRTFGASAAAFILFMAFSGLAINHAGSLGLERQHVSQHFLLSWYGIGEPGQIRSYPAQSHWVSFADSQAYFDGHFISTISNGVGAVESGELLVAAGGSELLLLGLNGALVERIPWDHLDSGAIEAVGLLENEMVVVKSAGALWVADEQLLQWRPIADNSMTPVWSEPAREPEEIRQAVIEQYRGDGPSLERLLLDLHSGRIFGPVGVLVYDLLALVVGFLAVSGIVFWIRGRQNGKSKYP